MIYDHQLRGTCHAITPIYVDVAVAKTLPRDIGVERLGALEAGCTRATVTTYEAHMAIAIGLFAKCLISKTNL